MKKFGLTGFPLGHSMSPVIHKALFKINGMDASYELKEVHPDSFSQGVEELKKLNGFNVTIPHKTNIIPFLDGLSERAELFGAVNTVHNKDGVLTGYNTDCFGFLRALEMAGIELKGKVLLCGSGGVSRMFAFESVLAGAIGDQPGALFGQGCFNIGQAKNTYGTGCFLLMNTGDKKVNSRSNLLSGIAWGIGDKITYSLEGSAFNAGSVIKWLRDEVELIHSAPECDELASEVEDANGLYFVPAFTGLGAPYWDMYARGTMIGLTRGVNRKHICRAVLESITFQMTDLLEAMMSDSDIMLKDLRVDGGASVSDIMMQIQADMTGVPVNRPKNIETTALGAAYCAGLATGVWENTDEIEANRQVDKMFIPSMETTLRNKKYSDWKRAVERSRNWER